MQARYINKYKSESCPAVLLFELIMWFGHLVLVITPKIPQMQWMKF